MLQKDPMSIIFHQSVIYALGTNSTFNFGASVSQSFLISPPWGITPMQNHLSTTTSLSIYNSVVYSLSSSNTTVLTKTGYMVEVLDNVSDFSFIHQK